MTRRQQTITTTGVLPIGGGTVQRTAAIAVLISAASGTPTFSITPRGRPTLSRLPGGAQDTSVPLDATAPALAYRNLTLVGDIAGTTPITAVGLYEIPASALDVALDVTAISGGTLLVTIAGSASAA
jgi:hypothetical protein